MRVLQYGLPSRSRPKPELPVRLTHLIRATRTLPYRTVVRAQTPTQQALGDGVTGDMIGLIICALVTLVIIMVGPFFVSAIFNYHLSFIHHLSTTCPPFDRYRSWVTYVQYQVGSEEERKARVVQGWVMGACTHATPGS